MKFHRRINRAKTQSRKVLVSFLSFWRRKDHTRSSTKIGDFLYEINRAKAQSRKV